MPDGLREVNPTNRETRVGKNPYPRFEERSSLVIVRSPKWGAGSANVQPLVGQRTILVDVCHVAPCSPLRRVPEVPHSISGCFQSIP